MPHKTGKKKALKHYPASKALKKTGGVKAGFRKSTKGDYYVHIRRHK